MRNWMTGAAGRAATDWRAPPLPRPLDPSLLEGFHGSRGDLPRARQRQGRGSAPIRGGGRPPALRGVGLLEQEDPIALA